MECVSGRLLSLSLSFVPSLVPSQHPPPFCIIPLHNLPCPMLKSTKLQRLQVAFSPPYIGFGNATAPAVHLAEAYSRVVSVSFSRALAMKRSRGEAMWEGGSFNKEERRRVREREREGERCPSHIFVTDLT